MVAISRIDNSTNVRSDTLLEEFLRPPYAERPAAERALLAVADEHWVAGNNVPFWSWGEGPATLLVHGWGGRGTQLGGLVPPLVDAGRRVIAFDAPGHGDTPGARSTLVGFADAIAAVARRAGPIESIVAHSFGAAATTVALARGLAATRVAFVAPMFRVSASVARFAAAVGLAGADLDAFVAALSAANRGAAPDDLDGPILAPRLGASLLVVHDRADREVPHADGATAARTWPAAHLITTVGLGHRRILDDPHVIAIVRSFLTGTTYHDFVLDDAARLDRELADRELRRAAATR